MTETPPEVTRARPGPLDRFFGGSPLWVIVKLALIAILIGLVLDFLGLDALAILHGLQDLFYGLFDNIWDALETMLRWFLLGAVIVFPIWLIARLLKLGARD